MVGSSIAATSPLSRDSQQNLTVRWKPREPQVTASSSLKTGKGSRVASGSPVTEHDRLEVYGVKRYIDLNMSRLRTSILEVCVRSS